MKVCQRCKTEKPKSEYHRNRREVDGLAGYCKACMSAATKSWHDRNKDHTTARKLANSERRSEQQRLMVLSVRREVLTHYGGKCACCGETELMFLCIDHVNGGGRKHRDEVGGGNKVYRWLKANAYPEGFQVLCLNCNFTKDLVGGCPHHWSAEDRQKVETLCYQN